MANVLTKECPVKPGYLFDGVLGLNVAGQSGSLSFGYNLFAHTKETVESPTWHDNRYAVASFNYNTAGNFDHTAANNAYSAGSTNVDRETRAISESRLLPEHAATPLQMVHRLFTSISYQHGQEASYFVSCGGFADVWTKDNAALKEIGVWARAGIRF